MSTCGLGACRYGSGWDQAEDACSEDRATVSKDPCYTTLLADRDQWATCPIADPGSGLHHLRRNLVLGTFGVGGQELIILLGHPAYEHGSPGTIVRPHLELLTDRSLSREFDAVRLDWSFSGSILEISSVVFAFSRVSHENEHSDRLTTHEASLLS